jgi:hypothetical protein
LPWPLLHLRPSGRGPPPPPRLKRAPHARRAAGVARGWTRGANRITDMTSDSRTSGQSSVSRYPAQAPQTRPECAFRRGGRQVDMFTARDRVRIVAVTDCYGCNAPTSANAGTPS